MSSKFDGIIGAVDGVIVRVQSLGPALQKVMRCDRHDCCGVNLQAIVDHSDRFIWFSSSKFGTCADGRAFRETELFKRLENGLLTCCGTAPAGKYFIVGDNAYPLRSFLLHAFKGSHSSGTLEDTCTLTLFTSKRRCALIQTTAKDFVKLLARFQPQSMRD